MEENLIFIETELDRKDMIFGNILTPVIFFLFIKLNLILQVNPNN